MATIEDHVDELEGAIFWLMQHRAVVDFTSIETGVAIRVDGRMFIDETFLDVVREAMHGYQIASP